MLEHVRSGAPMLFHSLDYILFLALVVLGYWLLHRLNLLRLAFVFLASCLFYMAWHPLYIGLILFSTALDYVAGWRIHRGRSRGVRRAWLLASLVGNLGLLGVFKYFNFFSQAVADGLGLAGLQIQAPYLDVLLPVGISFYTFQTLSYTIDIYRGRLEPRRSFLKFAFFVTFFPQLVAGPIVRASELLPQLDRRPRLAPDRVSRGLFLLVTGLVKKIAIADYLSVNLVDRVFDNPQLYTAPEVVIGLYAFTMQIYCDFSGYTDVARGSAMLMGLELPENFDRPYQATNPGAFWRRWHMTLSSWLRDYLYFPLGGSKVSPARAYWNLWLTMFLIGIWHGAAWTFVLYGILQATAMVIHRFFYRMRGRTRDMVDPWPMRAFKIFCNLQFVVFSRILFRATGLDNAWDVTTRLFSGTTSVAQVSSGVWLVLIATFVAHYLPKRWFEGLGTTFVRLPAPVQGAALVGVGAALSMVATSQVVPYIYFQF
ncbi:MAG: MBOAT family O-acyltransferase [Myxococcota bacterium]